MNEKIKAIMAKAFEVPENQITEDTSQDTLDTWDSLHHIKMIVFLEREFNIIIPDEDVGKMISYKLVELIVNRCHETQV